MMNVFKKIYKDFFGIKEQTAPASKTKATIPGTDPKQLDQLKAFNQELTKTKDLLKMGEEEIAEAQLVNNITDYRGGVEYVLRDPSTAENVAREIEEWTAKKGFTVVSKKISKTGRIGYFYFRLGQDPALESQKIQGYLAQKPEIKHFRFNVRQQASPVAQRPQGKF
jgi:hypothetical protein